jgi:hypothetical protein
MNIVAKLWDAPGFMTLSVEAKLVATYICSKSVADGRVPGLLREGVGAIAEGVGGLTLDQAAAALKDIQRIGLIEVDPVARLIRVPMAPAEAPPRNSRHLTAWLHRWRELPDSHVKHAHLASLLETVKRLAKAGGKKGESWLEAWALSFGSLDPVTYPQVEKSQKDLFDSKDLIGQRGNNEDTRCQIDPDPDPVSDPDPVFASQVPDLIPEAPDTRSQEPEQQPVVLQVQEPGPTKAQKRDAAWKQVAGEFQEHYVEREGVKPTLEGKERKLLEPLVQLHGPDEVCRRIGILFTAPPAWMLRDGGSLDVKTFVAHFDKLARPATPATGPPRVEKTKAHTGDEIRAMVAEMRAKGIP